MKKILLVIWALGIVLICSFRTPVKYYEFYNSFVVTYTHIFSNRGKILLGQLVLYIVIWSVFIYLVYLLFRSIRKQK